MTWKACSKSPLQLPLSWAYQRLEHKPEMSLEPSGNPCWQNHAPDFPPSSQSVQARKGWGSLLKLLVSQKPKGFAELEPQGQVNGILS